MVAACESSPDDSHTSTGGRGGNGGGTGGTPIDPTPTDSLTLTCKASSSSAPLDIPANTLTKLDTDTTGVRGLALVYSRDGKVVLASPTADPGSEPATATRSRVMNFDLATRSWSTTETMFAASLTSTLQPAIAKDTAYSFTKVYGTKTLLEAIDLPALTNTAVDDESWKTADTPTWSAYRDYGDPFTSIVDTNLVWDSVNAQVLLLGGLAGGARKGTYGNWAFDPKSKTWKAASSGTETARTLFADLETASNDLRLVVAHARGLWHRGLSAEDLAAKIQADVVPAWQALDAELEELQGRVGALGGKSGLDAKSIERGKAKIGDAVTDYAAGTTLLASALEGETLTALDRVAVTLREAAWALAPEPPPRMSAAVAPLPDCSGFVLFGGTHGDFATADTWIYDFATQRYRQLWPEQSPSPRFGATFVGMTGGRALLLGVRSSAGASRRNHRTSRSRPRRGSSTRRR
ncbi:Hypothetical protein A7982_03272 [Minicystis rosea]|nr:Hypothetical protein A7982_03272 [Minicystis rosea]